MADQVGLVQVLNLIRKWMVGWVGLAHHQCESSRGLAADFQFGPSQLIPVLFHRDSWYWASVTPVSHRWCCHPLHPLHSTPIIVNVL